MRKRLLLRLTAAGLVLYQPLQTEDQVQIFNIKEEKRRKKTLEKNYKFIFSVGFLFDSLIHGEYEFNVNSHLIVRTMTK